MKRKAKLPPWHVGKISAGLIWQLGESVLSWNFFTLQTFFKKENKGSRLLFVAEKKYLKSLKQEQSGTTEMVKGSSDLSGCRKATFPPYQPV